ncbi:MAG: ABC transporter ATP-binding protein [Treponema sp.]|nr:ABC transporter ATP-binding protein [Treponema sp.]
MRLTGIKKKLGDFTLVIDNLAIEKPGIYGLIGPNGSGKSTLAKIMAGLVNPDEGDVDSEGLTDKDITFLSRKPYMMDDSVYNNLVYPLQVRNIKPDSYTTALFLSKMNFSSRSKQRAKSLSGGEQQKLAFLRAVIFKPKFIIVDEAMTAMDMDSLDYFENTIKEEQEKEQSIWIIISHQMPHIKRICDSVFFMYDGKMEIKGNIQEIFSGSANPHLEKYLRSYNG